ncbi:Hypothetical protein A7982_02054 [Minicystis rosea]|nr:Hypothetical protein A7982_02054 [Minicystis rosea]
MLAVLALGGGLGCVKSTYPIVHGGAFAASRPRSPLLDDEHLLEPPPQDDGLLGRILLEPYDATRPLVDQLAKNPCADALIDVEARPREAEIEDATRVPSADGKSYVYYHFAAIRRVEKAETKAYATCCRQASCGVGYVRALTFGEGEIASGRPTMPGGDADVAFEDGGRSLELTLASRHAVRGFLAVTIEAAYEQRRDAPRPAPEREAPQHERIEVRDDPHNPDRFELCTRSGCISENTFVQRYRARTGSHELDDFDRDHFGEDRWLGVATTGILGALLIPAGFGVAELADKAGSTPDERNRARIAGGMLGGLGLATLAMGMGILLTPRDGGTKDHHLSKSQAKRFVERYNRALQERR